jgi:hypothetical protein
VNKSLFQSLREDSELWMFIMIGVLFSIFLSLMYIPGFQNWLASLNLEFNFMRLAIWDWLLCMGIASICIGGFELAKYLFRKKEIVF